MKRYQECSWIVKLWRYRWMLLVPVKWVWGMWILRIDDKIIRDNFWSILVGEAQCNMKWYYSADEVKEILTNKKNR